MGMENACNSSYQPNSAAVEEMVMSTSASPPTQCRWSRERHPEGRQQPFKSARGAVCERLARGANLDDELKRGLQTANKTRNCSTIRRNGGPIRRTSCGFLRAAQLGSGP
jgi:hypothetical protein